MKQFKNLILLGIIFVFSNCTEYYMICSLNPFYLDKNVIVLDGIAGVWKAYPMHKENPNDTTQTKENVWRNADTTLYWKIEQKIGSKNLKTVTGQDSVVPEPEKFYLVKLVKNVETDSSLCTLKMVLFSINKHVYADFMPQENSFFEKSRFGFEAYYPIHTLARLTKVDDSYKLSWLSSENMQDMVESKRVKANYKWINSTERMLLTGSSKQLTWIINRFANETRFIDWENQSAMLQLNQLN